jgi:predicted PurR-regulated permease PerM
MALDLQQLFRTNKRLIIWLTFFALLYLVRDLFGLIFITFIISHIVNNIIQFWERHMTVPRRLCLITVYLIFIGVVVGVLSLVMPRMASETKIFLRQFPESLDTLHKWLDTLSETLSYGLPLFRGIKDTLTIDNIFGINRENLVPMAVKLLNQVTHYVTYFLLGIVFSFFILFDLPNLSAKTRALGHSRLRDFYEEMASSVARFAMVVGAAFQAQVSIALVNTSLTALGLWFLQIKPVALLSIIVFFCGLIPVLGLFISSVPILLLAFNSQGWTLALKAAAMIAFVHAMEAYVLNPHIFSAILKINPVLTLMILYIGYSLFGIWGILLGAPISVYIYRYVLLAEDDEAALTKEA